MEDMPTFTPSGGQPLLVRGTIQENFEDKMPLTSRYAWPRSASSLSTSSFPSRNSKNPFFARHNPHPQRVRHMKGLLNVPVCTVIDSPGAEEDVGRYMVGTPTIDQMRQRPLKSNHGLRLPINADSVVFAKEKAVPTIGLVPITQRWREELKKFTEASGIKSKNPYTNTTSYQVPQTRQGSRQGERPPPSRGQELPKNGEKPPSRGGEKPPSRNGEKPPSRQGDMPSVLQQGLPLQHITSESDADLTVLNMLIDILKPTHPDSIKSWLIYAPEREKEIVLDMIRAVCTCDNDFREGYNEVMKSPMYDDQLLQQESSLDLEEIQKYNEAKRKEKEELEKKKQEKEEAEKPRTPRSTVGPQGYSQYQWTSPGCKPSSPFIATEKKKEAVIELNKPRPGTAEAEIEEIRSRLQSRSSPRVFTHQKPSASRHSARPQTQQSVYVPPAEVLEPAAVRPPSHQSIKSQQSVIRSILSYKPQQNN